jgi:hypothetical protein
MFWGDSWSHILYENVFLNSQYGFQYEWLVTFQVHGEFFLLDSDNFIFLESKYAKYVLN